MTHTSTPSHPTITRSVLARAATAGLLAALPLGVIAPIATAGTETRTESVVPSDPWQLDCDHAQVWLWQQNRGHWEWGDCDMMTGHWEWRQNQGRWQWHHDRDIAPESAQSQFGHR